MHETLPAVQATKFFHDSGGGGGGGGGGGELLPLVDYMGRLCLKVVPFSGRRGTKG